MCKSPSSSSNNFSFNLNTAKQQNGKCLHIRNRKLQSFVCQIFGAFGSLGEKLDFFSPMGNFTFKAILVTIPQIPGSAQSKL